MREPKFFRRYDYDRARLPNAHLREMDNVKDLAQAKESSVWSIGYPGWGLLYYLVSCNLDYENANAIVETGTNVGASSIVLTQALIDSGCEGRLHTFEIDQDFADRAAANFSNANVAHRITQYVGDAKETLPRVAKDLGPITVAFLDGAHLVEDVVREFEAIVDFLTPNAIVIFDNTYLIAEEHEDQRVHGALAIIQARYGGNLINLPSVSWYTPGVAVWQRQPFDNQWNERQRLAHEA